MEFSSIAIRSSVDPSMDSAPDTCVKVDGNDNVWLLMLLSPSAGKEYNWDVFVEFAMDRDPDSVSLVFGSRSDRESLSPIFVCNASMVIFDTFTLSVSKAVRSSRIRWKKTSEIFPNHSFLPSLKAEHDRVTKLYDPPLLSGYWKCFLSVRVPRRIVGTCSTRT